MDIQEKERWNDLPEWLRCNSRDRSEWKCNHSGKVRRLCGKRAQISAFLFQRCKNLLSVTLTEGLKEIGDSAFRSCGLERLTLPESLTKVGGSAFASNVALETAVIKGKTEFELKTFDSCSNLTKVEFRNVSRHCRTTCSRIAPSSRRFSFR